MDKMVKQINKEVRGSLRLNYFRKFYEPDTIYEVHEGSDFTEITCRRFGDIQTYRVRGPVNRNFTVTER